MSIRLEVENYCQDCMDFSPDVTKPDRVWRSPEDAITLGDTIIRCEYRRRCGNIKRYLEQREKVEAVG